MAQTDTRPGFKLPWTTERNDTDQPVPESTEETTATSAAEGAEAAEPAHAEELVTTAMIEPTAAPVASAAPAARRPTKFMAELSRAMQAAVETSRDETMARLTADAKAVVEEIHNGATEEAAALRRRADDDVAAVRDWSKAEIARIREETEGRIAERKTALDGEMGAHALVIEARAERVTAAVSEFETRMATFFERLLAEEDPTRIATMAETMPEPPDLAGMAAAIAAPEIAPFDPVPSGTVERPMPEFGVTETPAPADADETAETAAVAARIAALVPDFAAAEAEAAAFDGELDEGEETSATPPAADDRPKASPVTPDDVVRGEHMVATRVTVVGLVSVASIASFKRSLSRVPGIAAIGVSSGPDGEFVFTVNHDAAMGLADAITALPGFDAHITAQAAREIEVTAHDPDAGE